MAVDRYSGSALILGSSPKMRIRHAGILRLSPSSVSTRLEDNVPSHLNYPRRGFGRDRADHSHLRASHRPGAQNSSGKTKKLTNDKRHPKRQAAKTENMIVIHAAALGTIASLITAPSGMSPVSTYRHRATASLRASAAYARRLPGSPRFIAARQRAAALILLPEPGNLDQDTAPQLSPALEMPWQRLVEPLS